MIKKIVYMFLLSTIIAVPAIAATEKDMSVNINRWNHSQFISNTDRQEFLSMLNEINQKNKNIDAPNESLSKYKYDFKNGKTLFTTEDVAKVKFYDWSNPNIVQSLSSSDAKLEVEWLIRLLRTEYGLYSWFGGDEVFESAKNNILNTLEELDSISIEAYQKLLIDNFSFIEDTHFMIGENNFRHNTALFSDENRPFYNLNGKFYTDKKCTQPVISINEQSPEKFIKRAIGQDGKLTWYIYVLTVTDDNTYSVKLKTEDTEEIVQLQKTNSNITKRFDESYKYIVENEIPYIQLNGMIFGDGDRTGGMAPTDEKSKQEFLSSVEEIKKYSNAMIDLSHNPGGNGMLPYEWFKLYTGYELQSNYSTLQIRAEEPLRSAENVKEYDDFKISEGFNVDGHYYVQLPEKQFIENSEPVLFALISGGTASAAEIFLDALHNIENTVSIGANTGGVLTNAANYGFELPMSGLYLQMGECLYYWDTDYFREGYGMEPDIYLTGENLQQRLNMFFDTYIK